MATRASELFDRLLASPIETIGQMVQEQERETEYLEFKGGTKLNPKELKRYWSQALSGFANTEGGLLIWGVDARKTKSADDPDVEIEAARELDYVPKPFELAEILERKRLNATADPVGGVQIKAFDAGSGPGFVACYIPEGKHKPYRASLDETQNYYQRVRDSFIVISHSFLRSLFYPHFTPNVSVEVTVKGEADYSGAGKSRASIRGEIRLHNEGTATARNVELKIVGPPKWSFSDWGRGRVITQSSTDSDSWVVLQCNSELHPGNNFLICKFGWEGEGKTIYGSGHGAARHVGGELPLTKLAMMVQVFATDSESQLIAVEFTLDEMKKGTTKQFYTD